MRFLLAAKVINNLKCVVAYMFGFDPSFTLFFNFK